jgi:hypothetical protein
MKRILGFLIIALTFLFTIGNLNAEQRKEIKVGDYWWNQPPPVKPAENPDAKKLPLISVKENEFVNPRGKQIIFRGLAISDPDKLERQGYWNKKHFEEVKKMGANIVRIPIHPIAWRERTPEVYLKLLDDAVKLLSTGILLAIWRWNFFRTRIITQQKKKPMSSGGLSPLISKETTRLLFTKYSMNQRTLLDFWAA